MVLGDAFSKLETFVWILNRISRSITWSLFTLKASYLVKWTISTWSFMWWCQFIDWLKFETKTFSVLCCAVKRSFSVRSAFCRRKFILAVFHRSLCPKFVRNPKMKHPKFCASVVQSNQPRSQGLAFSRPLKKRGPGNEAVVKSLRNGLLGNRWK